MSDKIYKLMRYLVNTFIYVVYGSGLIVISAMLLLLISSVGDSIHKWVLITGCVIVFIAWLIFFISDVFVNLKKENIIKKVFDDLGIVGFLYRVFIVFMGSFLFLYNAFVYLGVCSKEIQVLYKFLYTGFFLGSIYWVIHFIWKGGKNYKLLHISIQPIMIVLTLAGYCMDVFESVKIYVLFTVALYLILSLIVDIMEYLEDKKGGKNYSSPISYIAIVQDVDDTENSYKVTVKLQ